MAQYIIGGSFNFAGSLVAGDEVVIMNDQTEVLKMAIKSVEFVKGVVALRDMVSGSSVMVMENNGEPVSIGHNPFPLEPDFESAMQKYGKICVVMIQAYKKSLS